MSKIFRLFNIRTGSYLPYKHRTKEIAEDHKEQILSKTIALHDYDLEVIEGDDEWPLTWADGCDIIEYSRI